MSCNEWTRRLHSSVRGVASDWASSTHKSLVIKLQSNIHLTLRETTLYKITQSKRKFLTMCKTKHFCMGESFVYFTQATLIQQWILFEIYFRGLPKLKYRHVLPSHMKVYAYRQDFYYCICPSSKVNVPQPLRRCAHGPSHLQPLLCDRYGATSTCSTQHHLQQARQLWEPGNHSKHHKISIITLLTVIELLY